MSEESGFHAGNSGYSEETGTVMPPADGSGGPGGSSSSNSGPSQGFMGFSNAGRMASNMPSSLADGMSTRREANHKNRVQAAKELIDGTAGGQLASQTRQ